STGAMSLLGGQRLIAVDTETTGMIPGDGHELLEVATVVVDDAALAAGWSSLLKPARPIPLDASAVHRITDAMAAPAPAARPGRRRAGPPLRPGHVGFPHGILRPAVPGRAVPRGRRAAARESGGRYPGARARARRAGQQLARPSGRADRAAGRAVPPGARRCA